MQVLRRLRSIHTIRQRPIVALLVIIAYVTILLGLWLFVLAHRLILKGGLNLPISDVTAIVQSTLGPAVAIGGAIATVYLAVLGLQIVENQSAREDSKQVTEFIGKSLGPFLRLNTVLVELITMLDATGWWMLSAFDKFANAEMEKAGAVQVVMSPEEIARKVFGSGRAFQETSLNLASELCLEMDQALAAISSSPEALALWRVCKSRARVEELGMRPNRDNLKLHSSPATVRAMLYGLRDAYRSALNDTEFQTIMILRLHRYRAQKLINYEAMGDDDLNIQIFLMSAFIFSRDDSAKWKGKNTTAAAILDCFDATPGVLETISFIEKQFFSGKTLPSVIRNYIFACAPSDTVPPLFRSLLSKTAEEILILSNRDDLSEADG